MNRNTTTILIIAIGVIALYFITRSEIFQMNYYQNEHAATAGSQF